MTGLTGIMVAIRQERGLPNPSYPPDWKRGDPDPFDTEAEREVRAEALRRMAAEAKD